MEVSTSNKGFPLDVRFDPDQCNQYLSFRNFLYLIGADAFCRMNDAQRVVHVGAFCPRFGRDEAGAARGTLDCSDLERGQVINELYIWSLAAGCPIHKVVDKAQKRTDLLCSSCGCQLYCHEKCKKKVSCCRMWTVSWCNIHRCDCQIFTRDGQRFISSMDHFSKPGCYRPTVPNREPILLEPNLGGPPFWLDFSCALIGMLVNCYISFKGSSIALLKNELNNEFAPEGVDIIRFFGDVCGLIGTDNDKVLLRLIVHSLMKMSNLSDEPDEPLLRPCLVCPAGTPADASTLYQLLIAQKTGQKPQDLMRRLFDKFSAQTTASATAFAKKTSKNNQDSNVNGKKSPKNNQDSNVNTIQGMRRDLIDLKSKAQALGGLDQFCFALDLADSLLGPRDKNNSPHTAPGLVISGCGSPSAVSPSESLDIDDDAGDGNGGSVDNDDAKPPAKKAPPKRKVPPTTQAPPASKTGGPCPPGQWRVDRR